jgi:hypothetical protein
MDQIPNYHINERRPVGTAGPNATRSKILLFQKPTTALGNNGMPGAGMGMVPQIIQETSALSSALSGTNMGTLYQNATRLQANYYT